jgi:hypothetical protein
MGVFIALGVAWFASSAVVGAIIGQVIRRGDHGTSDTPFVDHAADFDGGERRVIAG